MIFNKKIFLANQKLTMMEIGQCWGVRNILLGYEHRSVQHQIKSSITLLKNFKNHFNLNNYFQFIIRVLIHIKTTIHRQ